MTASMAFHCLRRSVVIFVAIISLSHIYLVYGYNFEGFLKEVGATMCRYLVQHHQLPRHYHRTCGEPTCNWDNWQDAIRQPHSVKANTSVQSKDGITRKRRIVVSYGHNGFGNQLWQHTAAFMIAESLGARLYVAMIPEALSPDGVTPPNTWNGIQTMDRLLPKDFLYDSLPLDSFDRKLCDAESFFIADRPKDWRNSTYTSSFKATLYDMLEDPKPRCMKFLGYFQNYPICRDEVRRMWTEKMFQNFTKKPGDNDISIYLRCLPRHYHFNDKLFYEVILNRTKFDNVWLFQAPECPTRIGDNPARDGIIAGVFRLLTTKYNAKRWPSPPGETDDIVLLLHDLAGLAQSKKLILPVSSWAFWGGLLSNATEIHVNAPPHHQLMYGMHQYYYHNEKGREYFGKLVDINGSLDIIYDVELNAAGKVMRDGIKGVNTPTEISQPVVIVLASNKSHDRTYEINELAIESKISSLDGTNITIELKRDIEGALDINIRENNHHKSHASKIQIHTATRYGNNSHHRTIQHEGNYSLHIP